MSDTISKWYEDKQNVAEMVQWNKGKLKKWEKLVADTCQKVQRFWTSAAVWGEKRLPSRTWGFRW